MSNIYTAAADFVLPVCASVTAGAVAFAAFLGRRESIVAVMATGAHTTDLVPTNGWSGSSAKRTAFVPSYAPQSRGSTG